MTDDSPQSDIEKRVSDLENRVDELEARLDAVESGENASAGRGDLSPSASSGAGTDHRDDAVLSVIRNGDGEPTPIQLVNLYQNHTDITRRSTAEQRAKQLRRKDAYDAAVEK